VATMGIEVRYVQADLSVSKATADRRTTPWAGTGAATCLIQQRAFTVQRAPVRDPLARWQDGLPVMCGPPPLCQGFVPGMLERGAGRVINVSSGASTGPDAQPGPLTR